MLARTPPKRKRPDGRTGSGLSEGAQERQAPGRFIWQLVGVLET
jgi:hypothetical protein